MKILEVIHGYPPRYNAGSEVYTQTIARGLSKAGHDISVFTREEDPYQLDFEIAEESDAIDKAIKLYVVNHSRSKDRFRHEGMDRAFAGVLREVDPDVVHIGHLSHLTTGIPEISRNHGSKVAFTFHDFWLACPRGQFTQTGLGEEEIWRSCSGQNDEKCARYCYSNRWTGTSMNNEKDMAFWSSWVDTRMKEIGRQIGTIDLFLSPANSLRKRMIEELDLPPEKVIYEPYGFDLTRLSGRVRQPEDDFVFGYIGRIVPAKGIDHLIRAFGMVEGESRLRIWGRPTFPDGQALTRIAESLPDTKQERIEWMPEYRNEDIVTEVFNHVDVIMVPSIWDENSPLVIQEAQQARVPVITSSHGGMGELVRHGVNGLTYRHRDVDELADRMNYAVKEQGKMVKLGKRGFLSSDNGDIHCINNHVERLMELFKELL